MNTSLEINERCAELLHAAKIGTVPGEGLLVVLVLTICSSQQRRCKMVLHVEYLLIRIPLNIFNIQSRKVSPRRKLERHLYPYKP